MNLIMVTYNIFMLMCVCVCVCVCVLLWALKTTHDFNVLNVLIEFDMSI